MGSRSDVELCGSDVELEGSDIIVGGSNAEVVPDTEPFSPLEVGVSTLSEVVDSPSSTFSTCSSETSIFAGKGELDVTLPELVTTVLREVMLVGYIDEVDAGHGGG